jgi:hypothetical protein
MATDVVSAAKPRRCLSVNGVSIGTLRPDVVRTLGEPRATRSGFDASMGHGKRLRLQYPGSKPEPGYLKDPPSDLYVTAFRVKSRSWALSPPIRVGMKRSELLSLLGRPESQRKRGGGERLWYSGTFQPACGDVIMVIDLRRDRIVEIRIEEDWS